MAMLQMILGSLQRSTDTRWILRPLRDGQARETKGEEEGKRVKEKERCMKEGKRGHSGQ